MCLHRDGLVARVVSEGSGPLYVQFAFRFGPVTMDSEPIEHQGVSLENLEPKKGGLKTAGDERKGWESIELQGVSWFKEY